MNLDKIPDITGQKFNRLTAVSIYGKDKNRSITWLWQCDCGNMIVKAPIRVRDGNTKSCGCLAAEIRKTRCVTHGMSKSPEFSVWVDMKKRCYNPNGHRYKQYSEKGIEVGEEFREDFLAWYEHVGPRPDDGRKWSIGRIDNTKGYVRDNMEWQLCSQQSKARAMPSSNKTGVTGVCMHQRSNRKGEYIEYSAYLTVDGKTYVKFFRTDRFDNAFELACEYREYLMKTYGKDFHESHGLKPVNRQ